MTSFTGERGTCINVQNGAPVYAMRFRPADLDAWLAQTRVKPRQDRETQ